MNAEAARGAEEVARQTQLLMDKMRAGSVPARPPPGSPLPKGYPGSPLRDRGKENRNKSRVQSSSPAKRTPLRPLKPLGNLQYLSVKGTVEDSPQHRLPLTPRRQPLNIPSPVVAAAGLARGVLDTSVSTDVMRKGKESARFITSTCARPQAARSRITPTHKLSVSLVKLKKSQLAGVKPVSQTLLKPPRKEKRDYDDEEEAAVHDLIPALERTDSDNFYPTPPVYRLSCLNLDMCNVHALWVHFCQISRERKKTAASGKSKMKHIEVDMGDPDQVR